jgi:type IV pilus biogenesis protein CpaD/CtpE
VAALTLVCALSLAATGCGSSDSGSDSAAPTATVRRSPATTAAPATTTTTAAPADQADFTEVMRAILTRRDEAYEQNRPEYLDEIYLPQCKCLEGEKAEISRRIAQGVHTAGERMSLLSAELINANGADEAAVRVSYEQGPSRLVDGAGRTVREQPTEPPSSLAFYLVRADGHWKVVSITPEGPVASGSKP